MASEMMNPVDASLFVSDFISAVILVTGTIFLMRFLKAFGGQKFKGPAVMIGTGILLFALVHEFGEFLCRTGIHGGSPNTLFGIVHIIVPGIAGSLMFFVGCYLLYRRYSAYLAE